jgi:hypothetical protein
MMSDFGGRGGGGSSKIGPNRTRGVGSLAKIEHPTILVCIRFLDWFIPKTNNVLSRKKGRTKGNGNWHARSECTMY